MTILFAGGEMGAFIPSSSGDIEGTAIDGAFNSAFARCCLSADGSGYVQTADFTSTDDIWVRADMKRTGGSSAAPARFELLDAADFPVFVLEANAAGTTLQMSYYTGAGYATIGSAITVDTDNTLQTVDVHIVGDSGAGTCSLYVAGTLRTSGTADLSAVDDMVRAKFYGRVGSVGNFGWSQVICATGESTIGMRLVTMYASGTGATDQWTGASTAIDEAVHSDADFIWSDTADQVEMFAGTLVGALTGYTIRAIAVTARANTDGTGPANIRMGVRTASTNYFSPSDMPLDAGYGAYCTVWETNPNTTLAWTAAEAAAIQFGVKSIA